MARTGTSPAMLPGATHTYLNSPIKEDLWTRPPEAVVVPYGFSYKLKNAPYSTRQDGHCLWTHLRNSLQTQGYTTSRYDASAFVNNSTKVIVWFPMDDGVVFGKDMKNINNLHDSIIDEFEMK
ncbi:hypothetical protein O181_011707 [Austropuccinia psidii MF-1]|uniref:Reverse transcriptase Ty1/copia-type domain-containing protein n=1 Tax=Austropuccinia psidii MF-1 TaxID=1389203 RepID=A0A9Q3BW78_9BASI|nr:hypothetical protein [Austropuccinia psidii MF-1]